MKQELLTQIDKLIQDEKHFIESRKNEVTIDFVVIESEIKLETCEKIQRLIEGIDD